MNMYGQLTLPFILGYVPSVIGVMNFLIWAAHKNYVRHRKYSVNLTLSSLFHELKGDIKPNNANNAQGV
jgi:hypothetical protein